MFGKLCIAVKDTNLELQSGSLDRFNPFAFPFATLYLFKAQIQFWEEDGLMHLLHLRKHFEVKQAKI